ncbi:MAG: hypothetical protein ACR2HJ_10360, partial [Fimbriimonadales bacterium]
DGRKQRRLVREWCQFLPRADSLKGLFFTSRTSQGMFEAACLIPRLEKLSVKWSSIKDLSPIPLPRAPIFAMLLNMAISRKREFLADASAAQFTRYPEALADALEKIAVDPEELESANNAIPYYDPAEPTVRGPCMHRAAGPQLNTSVLIFARTRP